MFRSLIYLFIACSLHLSAADQHIANYISEHAENTIARVESDKIFLHPEYLHFENGRAYLEVAYADFLELPARGLITSKGSEFYLNTIEQAKQKKYWRCVKCPWGVIQEEPPKICHNCGHDRFYFYYR